MSYATALNAPVRSQWEANSGSFTASQSNNCGPACMSYIATFYKDHVYGIESTRRLVAPCCRSTDISEQRDMLLKLGVPAAIYNIASLSQLKALINSGRRPVSLRIYMGRVPASVRGHGFSGWHAIVAVANGSAGVWIMDPNLRTGAFRYYSDSIVQSAFIAPQPAYAVVPLNIKAAPLPKPAPKPKPKPPIPPDKPVEEDMYQWVATMTRQNPKPLIVKKGAPAFDGIAGQRHGGTYAFPTDTRLECLGGVPSDSGWYWAARRYTGDGLFLIRAGDVKDWPKT